MKDYNRTDGFASHIDFNQATKGEYIHTFQSLLDIINDKRIKDICWLDDSSENEKNTHNLFADEIINCETRNNKSFNVLVPRVLFDYDYFEEWCKNNKKLIWIDEDRSNNIRGINYFKYKT